MEQMTLFDDRFCNVPLASRIRPTEFSDFVGQQHLIGRNKILRQIIENDQLTSMIFWGPPGVGKTTLANIIAKKTKAKFISLSAVISGIKEIKAVMDTAESSRRMGMKTILFVDEIHRFNKAQQDAFLPYIEKGSIILIGATTENPSFELNAALISRCRVFILKALQEQDLIRLIEIALSHPNGLKSQNVDITKEQIQIIAAFANGDARVALNILEMVVLNGIISAHGVKITQDSMEQCITRKSLLYDKHGEEHYNLISALHKSMRNSDPDASIYWMLRMLEGGENPLYIARRLVRFASEDIGMADSAALQVAISAYHACHFLGTPECDVNLVHAVTYLAVAPKSNSLYVACEECKRDIREKRIEPVPLHLRNASTNLMKEVGYGKGYEYAHNSEKKVTGMQCLPDLLKDRRYYQPTKQGEEEEVQKRLSEIENWKNLSEEMSDN